MGRQTGIMAMSRMLTFYYFCFLPLESKGAGKLLAIAVATKCKKLPNFVPAVIVVGFWDMLAQSFSTKCAGAPEDDFEPLWTIIPNAGRACLTQQSPIGGSCAASGFLLSLLLPQIEF